MFHRTGMQVSPCFPLRERSTSSEVMPCTWIVALLCNSSREKAARSGTGILWYPKAFSKMSSSMWSKALCTSIQMIVRASSYRVVFAKIITVPQKGCDKRGSKLYQKSVRRPRPPRCKRKKGWNLYISWDWWWILGIQIRMMGRRGDGTISIICNWLHYMMFFSAYSHQLKKLLGWCHKWLGITYQKKVTKRLRTLFGSSKKVIQKKLRFSKNVTLK